MRLDCGHWIPNYCFRNVTHVRQYTCSLPPHVICGIRVAHPFSCFCCGVLLCVLSIAFCVVLSVAITKVMWFVFTSRCCRRAHILFTWFAVCFHIVVSNTYCVVYWFCFSSSCVPYVASFSELSVCDCPFGILWHLL